MSEPSAIRFVTCYSRPELGSAPKPLILSAFSSRRDALVTQR
jgi:hypothetical protein